MLNNVINFIGVGINNSPERYSMLFTMSSTTISILTGDASPLIFDLLLLSVFIGLDNNHKKELVTGLVKGLCLGFSVGGALSYASDILNDPNTLFGGATEPKDEAAVDVMQP